MKVLKGVGLGILGFVLYMALSAFGMVYTMNNTLLNPSFMVTEVGKLDMVPLAKDVIASRLQIPSELTPIVNPIIDKSLNDLKPWMNDQVKIAVNSSYDYILGKTPEFKIVIQLDPAKEVVRTNIRNAPELQLLPAQLRDMALSMAEQQYFSQIPSSYTIDRSAIGSDGMNTLSQVRQVAGYIQSAYLWLIVLMVVLIICIILIHREVRGATRQLGTIALVCGVMDYAGFFISRSFIGSQLPSMSGLPASLQAWLPQFINDSIAPLQMFSIALIIIGVALLVVSFVYKPAAREPAS